MVAWFYFSMPTTKELEQRRAERALQDSLARVQEQLQQDSSLDNTADSEQVNPSVNGTNQLDNRGNDSAQQQQIQQQNLGMFEGSTASDTTEIIVETPLYTATFTNLGAGPSEIILKDYQTWDENPVQLIGDTLKSAYNIGFLTDENYNIETRNLLFHQINDENRIQIEEGEAADLSYELRLDNNRRLIVTYRILADTYELDVNVQFENLVDNISGNNFDFSWEPHLNHTEKDDVIENTNASAYVYAGDEMERLNLDEQGTDEITVNGTIQWISTRTKFFTQIIKTANETDAAVLNGRIIGQADQGTSKHQYSSLLRTEIPPSETVDLQLYVGPLSWNKLKRYEPSAYNMVDVGWSWMRWFAEPLVLYAIIPFLNGVGGYLGNYGLAIILFAVSIKIVLFPLTKKSFESMAAMKELQPEMKAIQEKYKDDPQKQQKATMKLYKEAKVNPLGGCLPNLLQFPILITLWRFFQSSIEIRQKSFLWASDLSAPDVILNLPFTVPLLGDHLAGFVLLMSATMVAQTQLTGSATGTPTGGPGGINMKAFQYILPLILLFVFNSFAAGLSLYYLIYNAMSIGQQLMIKKNIDHEEMMSKVDKKKARDLKRKNRKNK